MPDHPVTESFNSRGCVHRSLWQSACLDQVRERNLLYLRVQTGHLHGSPPSSEQTRVLEGTRWNLSLATKTALSSSRLWTERESTFFCKCRLQPGCRNYTPQWEWNHGIMSSFGEQKSKTNKAALRLRSHWQYGEGNLKRVSLLNKSNYSRALKHFISFPLCNLKHAQTLVSISSV